MKTSAWLCGVLLLFVAGSASAQLESAKQHEEKTAQETPKETATSLAASLGGTLNTGNTEMWQLTVGSDLLIVRDPHAFTAMLAFA